MFGPCHVALADWSENGCLTTKQIYPEILSDANTVASDIAADTNSAIERADDAEHERRDLAPWQHEQADELARVTANSDGVRERERHHGPAAGDDG